MQQTDQQAAYLYVSGAQEQRVQAKEKPPSTTIGDYEPVSAKPGRNRARSRQTTEKAEMANGIKPRIPPGRIRNSLLKPKRLIQGRQVSITSLDQRNKESNTHTAGRPSIQQKKQVSFSQISHESAAQSSLEPRRYIQRSKPKQSKQPPKRQKQTPERPSAKSRPPHPMSPSTPESTDPSSLADWFSDWPHAQRPVMRPACDSQRRHTPRALASQPASRLRHACVLAPLAAHPRERDAPRGMSVAGFRFAAGI